MADGITRRRFLAQMGSAAALAALAGGSGSALSLKRPNIVLIMADDLGYGDAGCYGCADIRTPAIDSIAEAGVRFTNFYSNAPECSPTRTALLTGRYQHRVGGLECALGIGNVGRYDDAMRLRETHDLGLPASETSIARMLKDAGYATALCGKWHLGYERKFFPDKHGFDHWFGPVGGSIDYFHHIEYTGENTLYLNSEPTQRKGYMTDMITDESVRFIDRAKAEAFFLYVAYTAPHTPYQGPDDYADEPVAEGDYNKGTRKTYVEMVERMDDGVGRILDALEQAGVDNNTLVIFMSDNGANKTGNNGPFSGYKGNVFEGGIRVPCVVRWPGRIKAGITSDQSCMTMDFSRSVVSIGHARAPSGRSFDGIDILLDVRAGKPIRPRTLFWRARRGPRTREAVRNGDLKYIRLCDGEETTEYLFDLKSDPAEKTNLIAARPGSATRLRARLARWERQVHHTR